MDQPQLPVDGKKVKYGGKDLTQAIPKGDVIYSDWYSYEVGHLLGKGVYGQVVKCVEVSTGAKLALKLQDPDDAASELDIMVRLNELDPDGCSFIECFEYFEWEGISCMVFELLDRTLLDVILKQHHFSLNEIRAIVHQLLLSLQILKSAGIVHSDIKLDNVMFTNHKARPLRVKLIDFGSAFLASVVKAGMLCQPDSLRAPEVILGLPFTEAIDMWSLGLLMAVMFLGTNLYPVIHEYDFLRLIIDTQGQPPADLLNNGERTQMFFTKDGDIWRFKTPEEYQNSDQNLNPDSKCLFKDLLEVTQHYEASSDLEAQDQCQFVDLLQKMLMLDPRERITPAEALQHDFITAPYLLNIYPGDSYEAFSGWPFIYSFSELTCHRSPSVDNTDGATNQWLKRMRQFVSRALNMIIKPARTIKTALSKMFCCQRCRNSHESSPQDSIVLNGNGHVHSGIKPSSVSVAAPDTREGADREPLKTIRNVISNVFRFLFKPFQKIYSLFNTRWG